MNENTNLTPESVQSEIKRTRHKAELPLYAITIVLGAIALGVACFFLFKDNGVLEAIKESLAKQDIKETSADFKTAFIMVLTIISFLGGIGFLAYYFIMYLFNYYKLYGKEISYSIRVSEKNFPEIYAKVQEYTRLLGLKKEPRVFVRQMGGDINAFACWVPGKYYVHLNAEIVDIAYMENKDFDTLFFVMAHEFGHLYFHHVNMFYMIWTTFIAYVPVLGSFIISPMYTRAKEYSADRVAQALTDGKNKEECMMLLSGGRHLYKYADINDYLEVINKGNNFIEKITRFIYNLMASHPIPPLRIKAMLDPEKKSGRLL